jgi:hypothetical protein
MRYNLRLGPGQDDNDQQTHYHKNSAVQPQRLDHGTTLEHFLSLLHHRHRGLLINAALLRERKHLLPTRVYDHSRSGARTEDDFETGARGYDEGGSLVIKG